MLNIKNYLTVVLCGLLMAPLLAQSSDLKIGYVNSPKLVQEAPPYIEALAFLKEEFKPREEELLAAQKRLKSREGLLARDGDIMSKEKRNKLERGIAVAKRDLRRGQVLLQEDFTMRSNEVLTKVQDLLRIAIQAIGEKEGYDMIFFEGVSYVNPRMDLTDLVLTYLKEMK